MAAMQENMGKAGGAEALHNVAEAQQENCTPVGEKETRRTAEAQESAGKAISGASQRKVRGTGLLRRAGRWCGLTLCALLGVVLLMQTAALLLGAVALCALCVGVAALLLPRAELRRACAVARRALCSGKVLLRMLDRVLPPEKAA